ncbi:MAG: hypothetical protein HYT79_11525 [Elusimicrobia bacterium]|nr:hypothetical protein [Elusimicrobiota bacterium]
MPTLTAPGAITNRRLFLGECFAAGLIFLSALAVNWFTGSYINKIAVNFPPAHDLLFQFLPPLDWPLVHIWGFVGFSATLAIGVFLYEPKSRWPYYVWTFSLLIATRAVFTMLTPLGLPHEAPAFGHYPLQWAAQHFDFRHTLFFSGHTALPFMGYLISRTPWVKRACLGFSLLLAFEVLASRLHYSIDVGAAFFITYGVYRISWLGYRRMQNFLISFL